MTSLFRVMRKLGLYRKKSKNPKYVPKSCIVGKAKKIEQKFYQYSAIDECTRIRFLMSFEEQSTYSSRIFLQELVRAFPFKIHKVQTDNGTVEYFYQ